MGYLVHDPNDLDDPALGLQSDEDIERFRSMAEALDVDGSLTWRARETIIRARILLSEASRALPWR